MFLAVGCYLAVGCVYVLIPILYNPSPHTKYQDVIIHYALLIAAIPN